MTDATTAFVTGGSGGIGRAVCAALAAAGCDVAIGYRSSDAGAEATAAEVRALGRRAVLVRGDVADDPARHVARAADELGGLTAFVACAVEPVQRPILELTADDWERTMRANARPFVLGAIEAARHMQDGRGRIVAVSATGAHVVRNPGYAPMALAKGVVEAAVRFLAVALAERGITANAIAPGPTPTKAFDALAEDAAALRARLARITPMGRLGEPEDAARAVAFLCSADAAWITGQLLFSDGGYSLV